MAAWTAANELGKMPIMCCNRVFSKYFLFLQRRLWIILALHFFCGCGQHEIRPQAKTGLQQTPGQAQELSPQERMRLEALERYRQMRQNMWQQYKRRPPQPRKTAKPVKKEQAKVAELEHDVIQSEDLAIETDPNLAIGSGSGTGSGDDALADKAPVFSEEKLQELGMISEQLISYECIKRRLTEDGCQELNQLLRTACPINPEATVPDPIACMKKNLKQWR